MLKTSFKKYKKELEMNEDENKVSENTDLQKRYYLQRKYGKG